MIRILFDAYGSAYQDLFIRIDSSPTHVFIEDTSWIGSFITPDYFENSPGKLSEQELIQVSKTEVDGLINFWKNLLLTEEPECFLPLGLYDQGVTALRVIKGKKVDKISCVSTVDLTRFTIKAESFPKLQHKVNWEETPSYSSNWSLARSSILAGLNWSLAQLKLPIAPLQYDKR